MADFRFWCLFIDYLSCQLLRKSLCCLQVFRKKKSVSSCLDLSLCGVFFSLHNLNLQHFGVSYHGYAEVTQINLELKPNTTFLSTCLILNKDLSFSAHMKSVTKLSFWHLKTIVKMKNIIPKTGLGNPINAIFHVGQIIVLHPSLAFPIRTLDSCNSFCVELH